MIKNTTFQINDERILMFNFKEYLILERQGVALLDDIKKISSLYDKVLMLLEHRLREVKYTKENDLIHSMNKAQWKNHKISYYEQSESVIIKIPLNSLKLEALKSNVSNISFIFNITDIKTQNPELIDELLYSNDDRINMGSYEYSDKDIYKFGTIIKNTGNIEFELTSCNGQLNKFVFFSLLFHEFNHFFQDIHQTIISDNKYIKELDAAERQILAILNEKISKASFYRTIYNLFYLLISSTEMNALLAGIFGELCASDIPMGDIKKYVRNCETYKFFDNLKNKYKKDFEYMDDEDWRPIMNICIETNYKRFGFYDYAYNGSVDRFKKNFIKVIEYKIKKFDKKNNPINKYFLFRTL